MRQSIARLLVVGVVLASAGTYATRLSSQDAPDVTPPYVAVGSPGLDAIVSGIVTVTAAAVDQFTVAGVRFYVNGKPLGVEDTVAPYSVEWDTASSGPGAHILSAVARDEAGNVGDSELHSVIVGAGTPPPPPPDNPNRAPVAVNDLLTTVSGVPLTFTSAALLANDSDPDGDQPLVTTVASSTTADGSVASNGDGSWTYTSAAGFTGTDTFIYSIADGRGGVASALVAVTVTAADPTPIAGLVASFSFDESTGTTVTDGSGSGHVGTIYGASRVEGVRGSSLQFDGVDDWVTVPDAPTLDLSTGMTLEAWVMPGAMTGWETVLLKERGVEDFAYALYAHDGGSLAGGAPVPSGNVRTGGGHQNLRGTSTLPAGVWTHLATTYDGVTQQLFVNGVQAASRPQAGSILASDGSLRIGGNAAFTGEFFEGRLDEVRIYNRALSAEEISASMGGAAPPPPPPPPPPDPSEGLVLRLDFDEPSGDAADTSGLGHVGTISGAVRVAGVRGTGLQFDGLNDWVTVPDAPSLDLTTGMTVEAWVKPAALTNWMTVVLKESPGGLAYGLYANDDAARPAGYLNAGAGDVAVAGAPQLPADAWTHVALTYDGTTMRLYVDGAEVAVRAQTGGIITTTGAFRIGGNASWGEYFTGVIDEVRVYNRALSAAEIARDMGTM